MTTEFPSVEIKVYELMGKRNIRTIRELSQKAGLSSKAVSAALNNKNKKMSFETIAKLCKALECDVNDLIVLVDKQSPQKCVLEIKEVLKDFEG